MVLGTLPVDVADDLVALAKRDRRAGLPTKHSAISSRVMSCATSPSPGVAEAAGAQRDQPARSPGPRCGRTSRTCRPGRAGRRRSSRRGAPCPSGPNTRTMRRAVGVRERRQLRRAASRSAPSTRSWIASMPISRQVLEADRHGGQPEVVDGAVLEAGVAGREVVPALALDRGERDRAAGEPGPPQLARAPRGGRSARRRRSGSRTSCRTTAARSRAGPPRGRAGWSGAKAAQSSSTSQPCSCAHVDPLERVLHAAEVRLRGEGEQVAARRTPRRRARALDQSRRRAAGRARARAGT